MSSNIMKKVTRGLFFLLMISIGGVALAAYDLNFPPPVTDNAKIMDDQNMFSIWVCVVIAIVVYGAMIYSIIFHRKSKGAVPADFHESTALEIAWTVVPFLILIAFGVSATKGLLKIYDHSGSELEVRVIGSQFKWEYQYLGKDGKVAYSFISQIKQSHKDASAAGGTKYKEIKNYLLDVDKPLRIPVGIKVKYTITSNPGDVIHSWWVPRLGIKQDANPGYDNTASALIPKEYAGQSFRGKCAELCGVDHAYMPVVVKAVAKAEFDTWLKTASTKYIANRKALANAESWSDDKLMSEGKKLYEIHCFACHKKDGSGTPPTFPALKGSAMANGKAGAHIQIIIKGKASMPPFAQLNDAEIAAIATYERKSWGNTGSIIKPSEVTKARK